MPDADPYLNPGTDCLRNKLNITDKAALSAAEHEVTTERLIGLAQRKLKGDYDLKGLPRDQFVDRIAFHIGEINTIHPFRDGNGRAQCAFTRQLAGDAGWSLDWSQVKRADLDAASISALRDNHHQLREVLDSAISPIPPGAKAPAALLPSPMATVANDLISAAYPAPFTGQLARWGDRKATQHCPGSTNNVATTVSISCLSPAPQSCGGRDVV